MKYTEASSTISFDFNGSRRLNNIFWAAISSVGGLGFFLAGLSSFYKVNFLFFSESTKVNFLPQGILLLFYGTVGSVLGIFLILTIQWNVGSGYNEYNRDQQSVTLYRKRFPGKNKEWIVSYSFNEIKSIKMDIKEGLNPKRQLLLCLKDNREIPLTGTEQQISLLTLEQLEEYAITIAKYLNVFLERA